MRGWKGFGPLLLIGILGLAWMLFLSESGSRWLTAWIAPPPSSGPTVGRLVQLEGTAKRITAGRVRIENGPLSAPLELRDGDRLETEAKSRAVLALNSEDEIELSPLSAVILQLWNGTDPASPVYVTVLAGDLSLRKAGVRDRAYVVRDGRLYRPGQKADAKPMALTVLRSAPLDMEIAGDTPGDGDFTADTGEDTAEPASDDATDADADGKTAATAPAMPETLSNEYIDDTIASRQGQLQKCWMSRLQDHPDLKGQVTLQFEISRSGKVHELKIADSSLHDDALIKCVSSVIERIVFRGFNGPEISLSYPIRFE